MIDFIKLLPDDIIQKIISYSYSPQPKKLLADIRDYTHTLNFVGYIYYNRWIIDEGESEPEDRNWLANDIIRYISCHDDRGTWLCQDHILRRLFLINDLLQSQRYVYILDKMTAEQELRRYWGLMLPKERHEMIDRFAMGWKI